MNRTYNFEKVFEQVRQNIDLPEGSVPLLSKNKNEWIKSIFGGVHNVVR